MSSSSGKKRSLLATAAGNGAEELVKKFSGVIEASDIRGKFDKLQEICEGPVTICREKLGVLTR